MALLSCCSVALVGGAGAGHDYERYAAAGVGISLNVPAAFYTIAVGGGPGGVALRWREGPYAALEVTALGRDAPAEDVWFQANFLASYDVRGEVTLRPLGDADLARIGADEGLWVATSAGETMTRALFLAVGARCIRVVAAFPAGDVALAEAADMILASVAVDDGAAVREEGPAPGAVKE